jgi:diguanylate cyclase (GGDEF)-like protein
MLDQLAELRAEYAEGLPAKLANLTTTWERCRQPDADAPLCAEFHRLAHSLAGTGATFGFPALSVAAQLLAQYVKDSMSAPQPHELLGSDEARAMIAALYAAANLAPAALLSADRAAPIVTVRPERGAHDATLVFLIDDDATHADDLATQLRYFGYTVRVFAQPDELPTAVQAARPAALIVNVTLPEGETAGIDLLMQLQSGLAEPIPALLLASHGDLQGRLRAVRAGGMAYFTKPINLNTLIDTLDRVTARQPPEPYRVLIVEDEPLLMTHYGNVLRQAGMLTAEVNDPDQLLATLRDFTPDLIVMDVYLPGCTGLELAAVIRQQEAYVSIPIVFLSTETELDRQLAALHLGGDDFLTKPIAPDHLVATLTSRGQRSRILRAFMVRDSLTGLLNHTRSTEQLSIELARAARQRTPLTLALIDIDFFKAVNDTYGHPVGDQVIKSLARLLQQRLRRSDLLGRYGGEEFVVILPDTTETAAGKLLDELRENFAAIHHRSGATEFGVTFSCGLAGFPQYSEVSQITEAADQALYAAKRGGRNQIAIAGRPELTSCEERSL